MKPEPITSFESAVAMENIARGLRHARLARRDTQRVAADRLGVGLATYQRLETPDGAARAAASTLLTALCFYGFAADVLVLGDPGRDEEGLRLSVNIASRGRTQKVDYGD